MSSEMHALDKKVLFRAYIAILILGVLMTAVSRLELVGVSHFLGQLGISFSIIRTAIIFFMSLGSAIILALFLMGFKYDTPINITIFFTGIFFLAVFLGIVSTDVFFRGEFDPRLAEPIGVQSPVKIDSSHAHESH